MSASLYTHVMRYCPEPCTPPRCRGHRIPKPPAPPTPFEMAEPKLRRKVESMGAGRRVTAYRRQVRGRPLTVRQYRQLHRMVTRNARARAGAS